MMEFAVTVAGAAYLTKLLFALIGRIERPKRKAPYTHADQSKM